MNEKPDRVALWKQKYRTSETARVKAVRAMDETAKALKTAHRRIDDLIAAATKLKKEMDK